MLAAPEGVSGRSPCAPPEASEPIDEQIMPASLQIPGGPLLVATRCCGDGKGGRQPTRQWINIYRSDDEGRSFRHVARPVDQASRAHGEPA